MTSKLEKQFNRARSALVGKQIDSSCPNYGTEYLSTIVAVHGPANNPRMEIKSSVEYRVGDDVRCKEKTHLFRTADLYIDSREIDVPECEAIFWRVALDSEIYFDSLIDHERRFVGGEA